MTVVEQSFNPRSQEAIKVKNTSRESIIYLERLCGRCGIVVTKITSVDNLADPFNKPLTTKLFERHVDGMGVRPNPD